MRPAGFWTTQCKQAVVAILLAVGTVSTVSAASCPVCDAAIQHFGTEDGLSHNAVVALAQDTDGFVWLGTRDGLDRLDGVHVERFERIADEDLRAERMVALAPDTNGGLWVALRDALVHRAASGLQRKIPLLPEPSSSGIELTTLLADGAGVWVGAANRLWRVDGPASIAREVPTAGSFPIRALQRRGDQLVLLTGESTCRLQILSVESFMSLGDFPAPCVTTLRLVDDDLWLDARRIWRLGSEIPQPLVSAAALPLPYAILPWRGGLVFAGLHDTSWRAPDGSVYPLWRRSDLFGEILAAIIDRENVLWLAGYAGAWRLDPDSPAFAGLDDGDLDNQLAKLAVSDITRFTDRWWFATFGNGLLAWDDANGSWRTWADGDPASPWQRHCGDFLWDLRPTDSGLLINGNCRIGHDGGVVPEAQLTAAQVSRDSLLDASGRLWVAGPDGLFEISDGQHHLRLDGTFETLDEAPSGTLWLAQAFGTHRPPEARLTGYDTASGAIRHIVLPDGTRVYDMLADDTTLWLATGLGLLQVDTRTGVVQIHTPSQRDAGHVCYSLRADTYGALWIGSNRGLLRFDPTATGAHRFRHYDARDGLMISEFNRRSNAASQDGKLLFGGIGGVVQFDPNRAQTLPPPPRPRVTLARIWNRDGERRVVPQAGGKLMLAAGDLTVALDFAAPGFRRAGHVSFRYRLDGVDAAWVEDAGTRSVRYPRLAPGNYRFQLQAGNNEAGWRDAPQAPLLVFLPAWHESWLFRVPALFLLAAVVWALYHWRVARLLEVERLRTRIAADLHDEMGSELAAIGMSASMLGQGDGLDAGERKRLSGVAESAQRVAESMRDIVWYVNPEKDSVTALGERLQTLGRRLFGEDGIVVHNGWSNEDAGLPMSVRRELHLICREALTNVLRHADAATINLRLSSTAGGLLIEVNDNGRGFDTTSVCGGNGLGNMARRAASIGASLDVDSSPGKGTHVRIRLTHPRRGRTRSRELG